MPQVFHEIEKKIINALQNSPNLSIADIKQKTGLESDQVRRGVEWLKLKNLANVEPSRTYYYHFLQKGDEAISKGLPERRLVDEIENGTTSFEELKEILQSDFNAAIANAKKNNWITINKKENSTYFTLNDTSKESIEEIFLKKHDPNNDSTKLVPNSTDPGTIESLKERDNFIESESFSRNKIRLTDEGKRIKFAKQDLTHDEEITYDSLKKRPEFLEEIADSFQKITLTVEGKEINFEKMETTSGSIDVEANVPDVYPARTHPLKDTIQEIREIFVTLGFSEILGNLTQSSFWNFDALFTPQDHPAREMQDTFFLDKISAKKIATAEQIRKVSDSHKKNWRYYWDINEARKMVLRTHTTCVTIKHLAEKKPDEARVFSLGRVFRNEKVSYKHLVEFNQIEGIVVGKNATLRDLMGIQLEFYRRIGMKLYLNHECLLMIFFFFSLYQNEDLLAL